MRALLDALALVALAGCTSVPSAPPLPSGGPETVLVTQPATVPTFSNVSPPKGTAGVTLWGPVERLPSPPTAATSSNGVLDIIIDSRSIAGNVAARNGLGSVVLGYSFKVPVRAPQYHYTYDLRVTRADHGPTSVAQVVAYLNLHDQVNGASLWVGQIAFDTRCDKGGDVGWDAGTNTPMFNILAPNFSCRIFDAWLSMSFTVGPAQIAAAAAALRSRYPALRLSGNVADYELTHINLNPEVAVKPGEAARIDIGVARWQLSQQELK